MLGLTSGYLIVRLSSDYLSDLDSQVDWKNNFKFMYSEAIQNIYFKFIMITNKTFGAFKRLWVQWNHWLTGSITWFKALHVRFICVFHFFLPAHVSFSFSESLVVSFRWFFGSLISFGSATDSIFSLKK